MTKNIIHTIIICTLTLPFSLQSAAGGELSTSPTGTWLTDMAFGVGSDLLGWGAKKLGMQPVGYCIDKKAATLLKDAELTLELAFADNRQTEQTKTYARLLSNSNFEELVRRLNEHSYFEWMHILAEIQEDHYSSLLEFEKLNRINLTPILRFAVQLYLHQANERKQSGVNPKANTLRFDLRRIEYAPGYVESATPIFAMPKTPNGEAERETQLSAQTKTIRQFRESLTITSPAQRFERGIRKHTDQKFLEEYIDAPVEVTKSQRIYAVLVAYMSRQILLEKPFPDLFKDPEFVQVYNQAWDRNTHLRDLLYTRLKDDSLKVCEMYANHKENIAPFFAALACDLILSHEQKDDHVPDRFKALYLHEKIPHGKYIFMFLNSLTEEQKIKLLTAQSTSTDICRAVEADETQISLIAEIAKGGKLQQLLSDLQKAKIEPSAPATPLYPSIAPIDHSISSSSTNAGDSEETGSHHGHIDGEEHH